MEPSEKVERIEELRRDSRLKMEALGREGITDFPIGAARLEMLIEALLPWGDGTNEARIDLELRWEEHANDVLGQVIEQVSRAKLLQGVGGNGMGRMPPSNGRR